MKIFIAVALGMLCILAAGISGCNKNNFLSEKPNTDIAVPSSLSDLNMLLDNFDVTDNVSPGLPTISADEYYINSYASYQALISKTERNACIWSKDIYAGELQIADWTRPYQLVFYANTVLDALPALSQEDINSADGRNVRGWALYLRANAFFELLRAFAPAYDQSTAQTDLGIPLKKSANVDEIVQRSSVAECYSRIIGDIKTADTLLATTLNENHRNMPGKVAAFGLLARIYLYMRNYDSALICADSSLKYYNKLIDYNTISTTSSNPFLNDKTENITASQEKNNYQLNLCGPIAYVPIDSNIYKSFDDNDLRKPVYFNINNGLPFRKRGYIYGGFTAFTGLATDEMYLIKAECQARAGLVNESMGTLNDLLVTRWVTGLFIPFTAATAEEALQKILEERKKELLWRGTRWYDIIRLNKDGANITLHRSLNGQDYTLPPNDPRYVFPIPDDEIRLSGIQQNPR